MNSRFEFLAAYTLVFIYMKCSLGAYKINIDIHISEAIVKKLQKQLFLSISHIAFNLPLDTKVHCYIAELDNGLFHFHSRTLCTCQVSIAAHPKIEKKSLPRLAL